MSTHLWWCILSVLFIGTIGQESPCPNIFNYEHGGSRWYGVLRIPSSNFGSQIALVVKMSIGAQLPTSYVGKIELVGNDQQVAQIIQNGGIVTYKVNFPLPSPIPKLTSIEINNRQYCSGPPEDFSDNTQYVTSIKLDHALSTIKYGGNRNPQTSFVANTIQTVRPQINQRPQIYQQPQTTTSPQIYQQAVARPQINQQMYTINTTPRPQFVQPANRPIPQVNIVTQCGKSTLKLQPNALIKGGEITTPGEWPWVGALFMQSSGSIKFICSGSLISNTDIITAAHCVPKRKSESLLAKLGLHNINEWSDNIKVIPINETHVHPDFNSKSLHNDIAILKITRVEYTMYIQPVCIGVFDVEFANLVGRTGTVVGWGKDENGLSVTPEPKKAAAKVVSTEECQRSDPRIIPFTSSKTMCAGNKDGTGPCNGDSGGGLFFNFDGNWYVRGIVSNSLPDKETSEPCGLRDFVLYTDISKYRDWMNSIIRR